MDSSPTPRTTIPATGSQPPRLQTAWPEYREVGGDYIGELIDGRYRIIRRLAKGGMAHVFLAKDLTRKCHVALKLLHRTGAEERRRFELEVQVLSNLQDEHVVRAIDYGTLDRQPYIALEYLEGETLAQRLTRGPLPWREAATYGIQIAAALQALHDLGIVHRDIKPDNIMLALVADRTVAKLIDLGLASIGTPFHQAQEAHFASQITQRRKTELGHPIGTPAYLPPEAGLCDAEPRLDVYSLGVTLYQTLTRRLPDRGGMQPMQEVCPGSAAPDDLSRLLRQALDPDVDARLPSADHLRRGLEAILAAHLPTPMKHLYGGSYDRLDVLGVGASAVVYRASDRELERDVALKVLRAAEPSEDDVIRFRRAAKILSALHHPNIPRILHLGVHVADGREERFAVTELCPGTAATDYTRPGRHLRLDEVLAVGGQLASALAAVHAIGVVYRDLHVGNVLIARGEAPRAWLYDFDHSFVSPEFYAHLTGRHATPPEKRAVPAREQPLVRVDYAAPEVRAGGAFSAASDVFALGLLLYRLLTGKRPFQPGHTEAPSACKLCPACPPELDRVLMTMLNADPAQRPTLAAVQEALAHALADLDHATKDVPREPPVEVPPSAPPTVEAPSAPADALGEPTPQTSATSASPEQVGAVTSRPHRGWAIAAALLVVFALGAAAGLQLGSRRDDPQVARVLSHVEEDMPQRSGHGASPKSAPPVEPTPEPPADPTPAQPVEPMPATTLGLRPASPVPSAAAESPTPRRGGRARPAPSVQAQLAAAEVRARRCLRDVIPSPLYVTLRAGAEPQIDGPGPEAARVCLRKALAAVTLPADAPPRQYTFFATP